MTPLTLLSPAGVVFGLLAVVVLISYQMFKSIAAGNQFNLVDDDVRRAPVPLPTQGFAHCLRVAGGFGVVRSLLRHALRHRPRPLFGLVRTLSCGFRTVEMLSSAQPLTSRPSRRGQVLLALAHCPSLCRDEAFPRLGLRRWCGRARTRRGQPKQEGAPSGCQVREAGQVSGAARTAAQL